MELPVRFRRGTPPKQQPRLVLFSACSIPSEFRTEGRAAWQQAQQPTLYLHGSADGCIGVELVRGAERHLGPGSRMAVAEGAGHLLHLERPEEASGHVLAWVGG
jgi:pimeloyl-ACP methyl ester carboxylesterase